MNIFREKIEGEIFEMKPDPYHPSENEFQELHIKTTTRGQMKLRVPGKYIKENGLHLNGNISFLNWKAKIFNLVFRNPIQDLTPSTEQWKN
jgi:hypothetical protein